MPADEQQPWQQLWRDVAALAPGKWTIEGKELAQSALVPEAVTMIGELSLTHFDLTLDVMVTEGVGEVRLFFRTMYRNESGIALLGGSKNTVHALTRRSGREWVNLKSWAKSSTRLGQWHTVKLEVREKECVLWLDGREVSRGPADKLLPEGRIGIGTADTAARFRNIRVTSPDGKVLFEGVPALP